MGRVTACKYCGQELHTGNLYNHHNGANGWVPCAHVNGYYDGNGYHHSAANILHNPDEGGLRPAAWDYGGNRE